MFESVGSSLQRRGRFDALALLPETPLSRTKSVLPLLAGTDALALLPEAPLSRIKSVLRLLAGTDVLALLPETSLSRKKSVMPLLAGTDALALLPETPLSRNKSVMRLLAGTDALALLSAKSNACIQPVSWLAAACSSFCAMRAQKTTQKCTQAADIRAAVQKTRARKLDLQTATETHT